VDVADNRRTGRVKSRGERVAVERVQSAGRVGLGLLAALHLALDCDQPCGRGPVGRGPGGVRGLGFAVGRAGGTERGFVAGLLHLGQLEQARGLGPSAAVSATQPADAFLELLHASLDPLERLQRRLERLDLGAWEALRWRGDAERLPQSSPVVVELDALGLGQGVQGEFLHVAAVEKPGDAGDERIGGCGELGVDAHVAASDVEARLVAVTRERRKAPLAVELLAAQDERAVDGGALRAVGGDRVAVLQVPGGEVDASSRT